ncbi:MAG: type II toxin-antitoxin system RelE/ParE family toxin [Hyphomicrobiales bacterium]|nr:type II toxin-antitoxin system RelE/ParE family toxin [Hyphomicrobiales bacterium]
MQQLLYSPTALNDIDSIYDYTFETWGLDQAEYYMRELHKACHGLAAGNTKGRSVGYIRQGYLKKPYGSHLIFYRHPNPKNNGSGAYSSSENGC